MNGDRDLDRVLETWLSEGNSEMPDRLFDAITDRIERVPQARIARLHLRFSDMQPNQRFAAAAAIILLVVVGGFAVLGRFSDRSSGGPAASPVPPTAVPSATASASVGALPTPGLLPFSPSGIAVAPDGTVYASDCGASAVYRITPSQAPVRIMGQGMAVADAGGLFCPFGVTLDATGNLFVVFTDDLQDLGMAQVLKRTPGGVTTIVAGGVRRAADDIPGVQSGEGGPATQARLIEPIDVAVDTDGTLYIACHDGHRVLKVDPAGILTTFAGNGLAGTTKDGVQATATSIEPFGVALDGHGGLLISEGTRIQRVDPTGVITTIAGTGVSSVTGDGGLATAATFSDVESMMFDGAGNLYVGDATANRVRRIDASGRITAFAGSGEVGFAGDGGLATAAKLNSRDLSVNTAIDSQGRVYIVDSANNRIRVVDTNGIISTLGG
jgi:hypothetical protein